MRTKHPDATKLKGTDGILLSNLFMQRVLFIDLHVHY